MDRNGRIVTRHVKPDTGSGSKALNTPPPALLSQREMNIGLLLTPLTERASNSQVAAYRYFLNGCSESTLESAANAVMNGDDVIEAQVIAEVIRKRDEDFLLSVAASYPHWAAMAESFAGEDNEIPGNDLQNFAHDLFGVQRNMFMDNASYSSSDLYPSKPSPLDHDELAESFGLEFFGRQLMLASHSRTIRDYYRKLDLLSQDMSGVAATLPKLMEMNESKAVMNKHGKAVARPLTADEVMTIVGLSREYPGSIDGITAFVCERKSFDESAVREFLTSDQTPLTRGIL